ncbi:MAG: SDR family oxidoreductase [Candidatus Protistobacter heckmanni]|nr:SDR family oxidoreductase [Candidatus Protistobacter heckmanni]
MILLTGADGFVGSALHHALQAQGMASVCATRQPRQACVAVGAIDGATDWAPCMNGVDRVVHLAARVHVMRDTEPDVLAAYRKVNVAGSVNLARQAAAAGVRRFVFISSIKVNGEGGVQAAPYRADDRPAPEDPYGVSKLEAENALLDLARQTGMEVVIIRPVLVYGPGVKANFRKLMQLVRAGFPLPLGAVHNRRSLVALDNLVDLILVCLRHPAAANRVFLAADGEDVSTPELIRRLAAAMGRPARLLPVPALLLRIGAVLLGRRNAANRMLGSLQADISLNRDILGWCPPLSLSQGLMEAVKDFQESSQ